MVLTDHDEAVYQHMTYKPLIKCTLGLNKEMLKQQDSFC